MDAEKRYNAGYKSMEYDVIVNIKIYPEDNSKIEDIKKHINKLAKVQKVWEEEIAFGAKAIKAALLMNDKQGGLDSLEEKIKVIPGVSEIEVEEISRI